MTMPEELIVRVVTRMIDIHCHILPNVDDGPDHVELSLAMARQAADEGITHIIATPHHRNGRFENAKADILREVEKFNERLEKENIPVTILPGQETRMNGDMLADYESGNILTLNNTDRYVFVEFPPNDVPAYAAHLLFDLKMKGLVPVIVHPERNRAIMEKPNRLYRLIKDGSLSQVTAASIVGKFGKKIQEFSLELIEHSLVHFIASDAHNVTSRAFHMRAAYREITKEFGYDVADEFQTNAIRVMNGEDIYIDEPVEFRRKKKRFRFF